MPQGAQRATYCAQEITLKLAELASLLRFFAIYDDVLIYGSTREEVSVDTTGFLDECARFQAILNLDKCKLEPQTLILFAGVLCDLINHTVTTDPAFTVPEVSSIVSPRSGFKFIGCLVWAARIHDIPLHHAYHILAWMRKVAKDIEAAQTTWDSYIINFVFQEVFYWNDKMFRNQKSTRKAYVHLF